MSKNSPKYHHLIPRTYLRDWCYNEKSVWAYNKKTEKTEERNIDNICGVSNFHSIGAKSITDSESSLKIIWSFLDDYTIFYVDDTSNKVDLEKRIEKQKYYTFFDQWEIHLPDGRKPTKKERNMIKNQIEANKDKSIEEKWSALYEQGWNSFSKTLFQVIVDVKNRKKGKFLSKALCDKLMDYFVMFNWRGYKGNEDIRKLFDMIETWVPLAEIEIPVEHRAHAKILTAADDLKHGFLLSEFNKFFDSQGSMQRQAELMKSHLTPVFHLAENDSFFFTSDNPAFVFTNTNGYLECFFPILPQLAVSFCKKYSNRPDDYSIGIINDLQLKHYNGKIFNNADTYVLYNRKGYEFKISKE